MSGRDANQLAADVPDEVLERIQRPHNFVPHSLYDEVTKLAENALGDILRERRELVALVGTLQQERDALGVLASRRRDEVRTAEARAEALQQERDEAWPMGTPGAERLVYWYRRAEAAEAALAWKDAALTNMTGWHNEAQAALAEARETVANLCTRPGTCLADTGGDSAEEGT